MPDELPTWLRDQFDATSRETRNIVMQLGGKSVPASDPRVPAMRKFIAELLQRSPYTMCEETLRSDGPMPSAILPVRNGIAILCLPCARATHRLLDLDDACDRCRKPPPDGLFWPLLGGGGPFIISLHLCEQCMIDLNGTLPEFL